MAVEDAAAQAAGEAARIEAENLARQQQQNSNEQVAAIAQAAAADIDAANAAAQDISRAAMASELGKQIQSNEERNATWRQTQETQLAEVKTGMGSILTALQNLVSPPAPPSSSIPPTSPEAPIPVMVVQPENQNVVAASPAPPTSHEPPRRNKVRL